MSAMLVEMLNCNFVIGKHKQ